MMRLLRLILICWFCWLVIGCATPYPQPMTANDLVNLSTGDALIAYLGQPDASPSVCDTRSAGPRLGEFTGDFQDALVQGFVGGKIPPALWARCVKRVLRNLPEDRAASFLDQLVREHNKLLRDPAIEEDPLAGERLVTLQRLYLERRSDQNGHPEVVQPMFEALRRTLEKADAQSAAKKDTGDGGMLTALLQLFKEWEPGPVARSMGYELLATVDIEKGRWQGRDVNVAMMDELAAAGNTMTLERFARRLPDPGLRTEASRRIIRTHIALSPFQEVRGAAKPVEELVLAEGSNRISLTEHPLVRAWFDPNNVPIRSVRVRQDVWRQGVKLLGVSAEREEPSVLPELPFRGALWAELKSLSRPVSVCQGRRSFDPSPCIDVSDLSLDNPFAYLDRGATFRFHDGVSVANVVPLAAANDFSLPVRIAGTPATTLSWSLSFEPPERLWFTGARNGGDGPDLNVHVERPHPSRFLFYVTRFSETYLAIVESSDLGQFRVASVGARGDAGYDGMDGRECQNGGNGGNGGPGGDGGDVHVRVFCGQYDCNETRTLIQSVVSSMGGAGGSGGAGGRGGPGRAASYATDANGKTVMTDPGCNAGWNGYDGYDGPNGSPGRVTLEVVP